MFDIIYHIFATIEFTLSVFRIKVTTQLHIFSFQKQTQVILKTNLSFNIFCVKYLSLISIYQNEHIT